VSRARDGQQFVRGRLGCRLGIFIDGREIATRDISINRLISVQDIRAMEVYNSAAWVPIEFRPPGDGCGVMLIWTR
jgi:hypothetical protein